MNYYFWYWWSLSFLFQRNLIGIAKSIQYFWIQSVIYAKLLWQDMDFCKANAFCADIREQKNVGGFPKVLRLWFLLTLSSWEVGQMFNTTVLECNKAQETKSFFWISGFCCYLHKVQSNSAMSCSLLSWIILLLMSLCCWESFWRAHCCWLCRAVAIHCACNSTLWRCTIILLVKAVNTQMKIQRFLCKRLSINCFHGLNPRSAKSLSIDSCYGWLRARQRYSINRKHRCVEVRGHHYKHMGWCCLWGATLHETFSLFPVRLGGI